MAQKTLNVFSKERNAIHISFMNDSGGLDERTIRPGETIIVPDTEVNNHVLSTWLNNNKVSVTKSSIDEVVEEPETLNKAPNVESAVSEQQQEGAESQGAGTPNADEEN